MEDLASQLKAGNGGARRMTGRPAVARALPTIAMLLLGPPSELAQQLPPDWLIVPGERVGPITAKTSETALEALFGVENVERVEVYIGEGSTVPGTAVYPHELTQRIEIIWQDDTRTVPKEVVLTGDASAWRTQEGISLGTTLHEIERLNGLPFRLAGFGWDYGERSLIAAEAVSECCGAPTLARGEARSPVRGSCFASLPITHARRTNRHLTK